MQTPEITPPHCQSYHTVQFTVQILPGLNAEGNLHYKYTPKIWVTGLSTCMKGRNRAAFSVLCMNNSFVSVSLYALHPASDPCLGLWQPEKKRLSLPSASGNSRWEGKVPSSGPARNRHFLHQLTLCSPVQDVSILTADGWRGTGIPLNSSR